VILAGVRLDRGVVVVPSKQPSKHEEAARATKNAVQQTYACVDGTTDNAAIKANACKDHGGVKVQAKVKSDICV